MRRAWGFTVATADRQTGEWMKRTLCLIALSALMTASVAVSAETSRSWFCVGEQSTGFAFRDGAWRQTNFTNEKYILKVRTQTDLDRCRGLELGKCPKFTGYVFAPFGQEFGDACRNNNPETIVCSGPVTYVIFDKSTLRFLHAYTAGYVDGDKPGNTPAISIGTCTPL